MAFLGVSHIEMYVWPGQLRILVLSTGGLLESTGAGSCRRVGRLCSCLALPAAPGCLPASAGARF